jgi:hypothetical protein
MTCNQCPGRRRWPLKNCWYPMETAVTLLPGPPDTSPSRLMGRENHCQVYRFCIGTQARRTLPANLRLTAAGTELPDTGAGPNLQRFTLRSATRHLGPARRSAESDRPGAPAQGAVAFATSRRRVGGHTARRIPVAPRLPMMQPKAARGRIVTLFTDLPPRNKGPALALVDPAQCEEVAISKDRAVVTDDKDPGFHKCT